ncbi:hypothetical protein [Amycolatopsis sp. NPDC051372]|uniref:hypothetical protein n=1 Tax=Amycolatopsis sp. NPDC051372 TaxID=3155669 RepID=UPI00342F08D5
MDIVENKPGPGDDHDALRLAKAWFLHVEKLDSDRALPPTDHTVWTEHDLAAALFMRDFVEDALAGLEPELADRVRPGVTAADDLFRSFTVEDPGDRMAKVAHIDLAGRGWWWFRVPASGLIAQDLAGY